MACLVGKAGLGDLDSPLVFVDQVVGVAKAQGVVGFAERHGFFLGGAQLAQHRVFTGRCQQLAQVAGRRHVMHRQAGWLNVAGVHHAQAFGFGVHGGNKRHVTARVMVRKRRRGTVFRGHEGNQHHVLARQFAAEFDA